LARFLVQVAEVGDYQVHLYLVSDPVFYLGEQNMFNPSLSGPMFSNVSTWMAPRSQFCVAHLMPDASSLYLLMATVVLGLSARLSVTGHAVFSLSMTEISVVSIAHTVLR
jgi:hypothetical protein